MRWDIFCKVIDNHGDLGVCWRLACQLATRGEPARLWIDDNSALAWMAPQGHADVTLVDWSDAAAVRQAADAPAPQVLIEAFGCDPAPELIERFAAQAQGGVRPHAWINLEYLSAEPYVERLHTLPSSVFRGPGAGLIKRFFYPGFTPRTGGLLREPRLAERRAAFDRAGWLASQGIAWRGERLVSLFCYEPAALPALLAQWTDDQRPTRLLVTSGRATQAVRHAWQQWSDSPPSEGENTGAGAGASRRGRLSVDFLPHLTQIDFDALLWACDLNFVRGEDSLVRALWARQPFVWQIYPQDDDAHHVKLAAFLDVLDAPPSLRAFHAAWNGIGETPAAWPDDATFEAWRRTATTACDRLSEAPDLATQLVEFVQTAGRR